ncbi:TPA: IclR family transcriptional regulator [Acinetobacter baumannii]|nr:IclR family transcriptional regulator [Acinetobacter baumannii]
MLVDEEKLQGRVQSLEVGLTVLDALIEHSAPLMLKELSEILSMHPAKVHRYVVSLIRKGYAQQLNDGRYALGERTQVIGLKAVSRIDMLEVIQKYIIEIQQTLNCSIHVSKWFSDGPIVMQTLESNHLFNIITRVGSRMPLLNSATGRLFASLLPESVIKPLLLKEWKNNTKLNIYPKDWKEFLELKKKIVDQKYSSIFGEMMVGINAVCIPVFNFNRQLELVITCIGTDDQLPKENLENIVEYLMEVHLKINIFK